MHSAKKAAAEPQPNNPRKNNNQNETNHTRGAEPVRAVRRWTAQLSLHCQRNRPRAGDAL